MLHNTTKIIILSFDHRTQSKYSNNSSTAFALLCREWQRMKSEYNWRTGQRALTLDDLTRFPCVLCVRPIKWLMEFKRIYVCGWECKKSVPHPQIQRHCKSERIAVRCYDDAIDKKQRTRMTSLRIYESRLSSVFRRTEHQSFESKIFIDENR